MTEVTSPSLDCTTLPVVDAWSVCHLLRCPVSPSRVGACNTARACQGCQQQPDTGFLPLQLSLSTCGHTETLMERPCQSGATLVVIPLAAHVKKTYICLCWIPCEPYLPATRVVTAPKTANNVISHNPYPTIRDSLGALTPMPDASGRD